MTASSSNKSMMRSAFSAQAEAPFTCNRSAADNSMIAFILGAICMASIIICVLLGVLVSLSLLALAILLVLVALTETNCPTVRQHA